MSRSIAIMQPYFMPYIGYWQLMAAVDEFVVYDNIEYTKKGWINRNRILEHDHDRLFTIPIKKDSDYLVVNKRFLSDDSRMEIDRILRSIKSNYQKAPQFATVFPVIEDCFLHSDKNLFGYIYNSIKKICAFLDIDTQLTISSEVDIDHSVKSEQKVLAICRAEKASTYINATGGRDLYNQDAFKAEGLDLKFIESAKIEYRQFSDNFVPNLSIIDIMMFNDKQAISEMLERYELV